MSKPRVAPYGSWASPIAARQIAEGSIGLLEPHLAGGSVYWLEVRPTEAGRYVVVRWDDDGTITDMLPPPFSARTRVHEYGGGSFLPRGDQVGFVNFADQRMYLVAEGEQPECVLEEDGLRYADFDCDTLRGRLLAVREDHRRPGEAVNTIASITPHGRGGRVLVDGNDFYSAPRVSPDGSRLAYLTWNHPLMPWDGAELWIAPIRENGSVAPGEHVAGGSGESVADPQWSPDGVLHFACDRDDWWRLYRVRGGEVERLTDLPAEFARPQWIFGRSSYAFVSKGSILCAVQQDGLSHLAMLDTATGEWTAIDVPYTAIDYVRAAAGRAVFIGGSAARPSAVVLMDIETGRTRELRRTTDLVLDEGYLSVPESVEFPTVGERTAHGLFYPPRNRDFTAPAEERPPLVVMVHGGPTSATSSALKLGIQYYTSRGLAVLDVNYGGSTGYGRAYRERLYGLWGVVDVDDCCAGAAHLAEAGRVDGERMAITGGSAGGYTTLSCLAFRDVFAAGASHFGVSDCEALAAETHKFESRYLDQLIGPYPERRDLYVERSPIHHVEGLSCPVIFFQGLEDQVVPPNQARRMADALRDKHVPVALLEFAGEQHGFRRAENIRRAIEAELYFFSRVLGFVPAGEIEPVEIENL